MDLHKIRHMAGLKRKPESTLAESIETLDFSAVTKLLQNTELSQEQLHEGLWSSIKGAVGTAASDAIVGLSRGKWKAQWQDLVKDLKAAQKKFDEIQKGILASTWYKDLEQSDKKSVEELKKIFDARKNAFTTVINDMTADNEAIGAKAGSDQSAGVKASEKPAEDKPVADGEKPVVDAEKTANTEKPTEGKPKTRNESRLLSSGEIFIGPKNIKEAVQTAVASTKKFKAFRTVKNWSIKYQAGGADNEELPTEIKSKSAKVEFKTATGDTVTMLEHGRRMYLFGRYEKSDTNAMEISAIVYNEKSGVYKFVAYSDSGAAMKFIDGGTINNADTTFKSVASQIAKLAD